MTDYMLALTTPIRPRWSFTKLKLNNQKWLISLSSILLCLLFLVPFIYLYHPREHISVWVPIQIISTTFFLNVVIVGSLIDILAGKLFARKINIVNGISVVSVSSLSFVVGFLLSFMLSEDNSFFILTGIFVWGILITLGIGKLYDSKIGKSSMLAFGILVPMLIIDAKLLRIL